MNVRRWWKRCTRYDPAISLRALGLLDGADAVALEAHLAGCAECRARAASAARTAAALQDWARVDTSAEPSAALRARWTREVLAEPGGEARSRRAAGRPERLPGAGPGRWSGERWAWTATAAAWVLIGLLRLGGPSPAPVRSDVARTDTAVAWRTLVLVLRGAGPERRGESAGAPPVEERNGEPGQAAPRGSVERREFEYPTV